jgi:hypothetical protein
VALRRRAHARGHELFPGFVDAVEIGRGTLATVFRAREIETDRAVALKLLNVRDASPRALESFQRESLALGALGSHPHIVTLYRSFPIPDGRPVLVLELCAGAVADRLRDGTRIPVREAVSIGIKIAGALETAHRGGILHRDVKPQNILVTEFGEPALSDFGVAMLQSSTQTTSGLFDFTTLHAAPELLEGGGTSAATDVYELASTLYQLIAGQSAFRAYEGESPASVILRILRDPVRPVEGVPVQLSDLLVRAMSKDQDDRPPTAAEFASELAGLEVEQGWPRTQFVIRGSASVDSATPRIIRMPEDAQTFTSPDADAPGATVEPPDTTRWGAPTYRAFSGATVSGRTPATSPIPTAAAALAVGPASADAARGGAVRDRVAPGSRPRVESLWLGRDITSVAPGSRPRESSDRLRTRVDIDDDEAMPFELPAGHGAAARPAAAGGRAGQAGQTYGTPAAAAESLRYPIPPAASVGATLSSSNDPYWALRTPASVPAPGDSRSEIEVVPAEFRLRVGRWSMTADSDELTLRFWWRRERLSWSEISGFEEHFPDGDAGLDTEGVLVAQTADGDVTLAAIRRPAADLRRTRDVLEGFRRRALPPATPRIDGSRSAG